MITFRNVVESLDPSSVRISGADDSIWAYADTVDGNYSVCWRMSFRCCPLHLFVCSILYANEKREVAYGGPKAWLYRPIYEAYRSDSKWQPEDVHDHIVPPAWLRKKIHTFAGAELSFAHARD